MPYFRMPDVFYTKPPEPTLKVKYGAKSMHHISVRIPAGTGPHPALLVIHGGKWKSNYTAKQTEYLCADLANHGIASCNIEFRRLGHTGGGWPGTFTDLADAVDHIMKNVDEWKIDRNKISLLGHSSGAHLAFCLSVGFSNRKPGFIPYSAIALAGVFDLSACAQLKPEIEQFFKGSEVIDPVKLLPLGVDQLLLCGAKDKLVDQTAAYAAKAEAAGDNAFVIVVDECSHFTIIDPTSPCWSVVRESIIGCAE